jgi:hypothetical protein
MHYGFQIFQQLAHARTTWALKPSGICAVGRRLKSAHKTGGEQTCHPGLQLSVLDIISGRDHAALVEPAEQVRKNVNAGRKVLEQCHGGSFQRKVF